MVFDFVSSLISSNSCNVVFSIFIITTELAIFTSNIKTKKGDKKKTPPQILLV